MNAKVIDVSKWQGDIDFDLVISDGVAGVIVKATEGRTGVDPNFVESWEALEVRQQRLVRGAYHFARVDTDGGDINDARAEARHFVEVLRDVGYSSRDNAVMPLALDVEWGGSAPGQKRNQDWCRAWLETVEDMLGCRTMIYAGAGFWKYRFGNTDEFVDRPLWQPHIRKGTPPKMPWPEWTLWQHSFKGRVAGIKGDVDLNWFAGDVAALRAWSFGTSRPNNPADQPGVMPQVDLARVNSSTFYAVVSVIQGLLLAHGYGPQGLIDESGYPDGVAGPVTLYSIGSFRESQMLGLSTVVDANTWHALLRG